MSARLRKSIASIAVSALLIVSVAGQTMAAPMPIGSFAQGAIAPQAPIENVGYRRHYGNRGAGAGAALALGLLGLGVAAIAAERHRYREEAYYPEPYQSYDPGPAYSEPQYAPQRQYYPVQQYEPQQYQPQQYGGPTYGPAGNYAQPSYSRPAYSAPAYYHGHHQHWEGHGNRFNTWNRREGGSNH